MTNTYTHREAWLEAFANCLRPWFNDQDYALPVKIRYSCGFPSRGGLKGTRRTVSGQCWYPDASADGYTEIFISPITANAQAVADILGHELIHAATGPGVGHKGVFKVLATDLGLVGKMTSTVGGPEYIALVAPFLADLGPYPHGELDAKSGPPKQPTRLVKVQCPLCEYSVRITRKWLDEPGAPFCPAHGEQMEES